MVIIINMVTFDEENEFAMPKATMLRNHLVGRDITDPAVLEVMARIPREQFIAEKMHPRAYADEPLPIGMGQTISQPYIVALMTEHLRLDKFCDVLEIGTGSGYQTAVLAKLAHRVYTIERYNQLSESAQAVLGRLGIDNVQYYISDGSKGWPAPDGQKQFDRIIITAAVPHVPEPLSEQLREDGILIAPVGGETSQELMVYEKKQNQLQCNFICACRFVKLIGDYGFSET